MANGSNSNNKPCERLYLLMSSPGGNIEDGFSLYNLLRALPTELITVNMGQIASIASVPFLAGSRRYACENSYFHFHDFEWPFTSAHTMSKENLADTAQLLEVGRANKKAVLKARTSLTDSDFDTLKLLDDPLIKDSAFAKDKGIVHEVGMPTLKGIPIFNLDY